MLSPPKIQGDQKVSVHLMITVQKTRKNILNSFNHLPWLVRIRDNRWRQCESSVPLALAVGVSICLLRLAGDTLNITCNFLYCNRKVHRDFLITVYLRFLLNHPVHTCMRYQYRMPGDKVYSGSNFSSVSFSEHICCYGARRVLPPSR
jgi:hypothetical protein